MYGEFTGVEPFGLCADKRIRSCLPVWGRAAHLGFLVLRVQAEFPDCEALRMVAEKRLQKVRIEFEQESRNFMRHMHYPAGCDLIVCWEHNWPECPLPVLELKKELG